MNSIPRSAGRLGPAGIFLLGVLALSLAGLPTLVSVVAAPVTTQVGQFRFINERRCDASWQSELNFQDPDLGPPDPPNHLIVLEDAVVNGQAYQPAWTDPLSPLVPYPLTAADFWDGSQPAGTSRFMRIDDRIILPIYDRSGPVGTFDPNWSGKAHHYAREDRGGIVKWKIVTTAGITPPPAPECVQIVIKKVVRGERADPAQVFTADVNLGNLVGQALDVPFSQLVPNNHALGGSEDAGPIDGSTFTVDESPPPANWTLMAWQVLHGNVACPPANAPISTDFGDFLDPAIWYGLDDPQFGPGPVYNAKKGNTVTVCFLNEYVAPRGNLRIEKYLDLNGDGDALDPGEKLIPWTVSVSGPDINGQFALDDVPGVKTFTNLFAGDFYTVTEAAMPGYRLTNTFAAGLDLGPLQSVTASVGSNAEQVVRFYNQPLGDLRVEKYLDINGDGDANDPGEGLIPWSVNVSGPDGALNGEHELASGILELTGLPHGDLYSFTESAVPGYFVTNATVNGASYGATASLSDVAVPFGGVTVARFYNQPLGGITVNKATWNVVNNIEKRNFDDDDGWTIRVASETCDITAAGITDANGKAAFEGLPLCDDYVVAEDLASPGAPGYSHVSPASVSGISPTLTGHTQVNFTNETRSVAVGGCAVCPVLNVPPPVVSTPAPPSATPSASPSPAPQPTGTIVPAPTASSGADPSPASTVAGDRTAGASTPIAPSAGAGALPAPARGPESVALAGLVVLAWSIALMALSRRRIG